VRRTYKFRLYPTKRKAKLLDEMLVDLCELYNAALTERRNAWEHAKRTTPVGEKPKSGISFYSQSGQLKDIKAADARYKRWASASQLWTLRRLDHAYGAYFRRMNAGQRAGLPRYKSESRFNSATFTTGATFLERQRMLKVMGIGEIRINIHRQVEGHVKNITVKREGDKWFALLHSEGIWYEPWETTGASIGLDFGLEHLVATSDGEFIENPRFDKVDSAKLKYLERVQAANGHRSEKRKKQIAELKRKNARRRRDHHRKVAHQIVKANDIIVLEDLDVRKMLESPAKMSESEKLKFHPVTKRRLNGAIRDAGWGQLRRFIETKAAEAGSLVIAVDPSYTSQACFECGHVDAANRVSRAKFRCQECGHEDHADVNAAKNILRRGQAPLSAPA